MTTNNPKPKLLLHACCAPCLTAVFEQIKNDYDITLFWFNPNIYPADEYVKRYEEVLRYAEIIGVTMVSVGDYLDDHHNWVKLTQELSNEKEGGHRCTKCFKYRLLQTALYASNHNFDYFATTLTVSPHKNSPTINKIGQEISDKNEIKFLDHDFGKNDVFKKSIELCKKHNIYRQKYCGCEYSINQN